MEWPPLVAWCESVAGWLAEAEARGLAAHAMIKQPDAATATIDWGVHFAKGVVIASQDTGKKTHTMHFKNNAEIRCLLLLLCRRRARARADKERQRDGGDGGCSGRLLARGG
jgi:hypothetical protein